MPGSRKINWNDVPFPPRKCPFFYGWAILVLGALGFLMSAPGQTMGVAPFTDALIAHLGLSRQQLSLAYMLGTIASSLLLTRAGMLYDRLGARIVGTVACVGLGSVLLVLSRVDRVVACLGGAASAAMCVMVVGFFLLRFFGQGVLTLVSRNMVMKWFDRRRGLAMGICGVFTTLGFSYSPRVLDDLIGRYTWRGAWVVLGVATAGGFAAVALALFRDRPEDCGLEPDGGVRPDRHSGRDKVQRQFSLSEARRTCALWVFCLSFFVFGLYFTAIAFHVVSIFEEGGMTRAQAFAIFFPASVISVLVRLAAGWMSDHLELKRLLLVMLAGMALSMAGAMKLAPGPAVTAVIVGNGVAGGLVGLLMGITWPRYYGSAHLGAISGFCMSTIVFGSAVGPWLFGQALARTRSYDAGVALCLAATLVLLVAALFADDPQGSQGGGPS